MPFFQPRRAISRARCPPRNCPVRCLRPRSPGPYSGSVNFTNSTNSFAGTYFGNGLNLTNLNGSLIATGTVADARLSTNVALLNGIQIFTGTNSFTNRANAFTGTFFGNGVVSWIPVGGTSTQAVANAGYLLLNTNLTTVTLPPTNSLLLGDVVRISSPGSGGWILAGSPGMMVRGNFFSYTNSLWIPAAIPGAGNWGGMAAAAGGSPMFAGGSPGVCISYNYGVTWNTETITGTTFYSVDCSSESGKLCMRPPIAALVPESSSVPPTAETPGAGSLGSR